MSRRRFGEGSFVAAFQHIRLIVFLSYLGCLELWHFGDRMSFVGGLIGCLGLEFELYFFGVVAIGAPAILFHGVIELMRYNFGLLRR